ncbi:MAG: glutamate--tRNA ligase [Acidimicrobiia bacterium]|nr:glutamate--tRNA ligase [Acidimicrobiia bacterium]
MTVRVRFSPAPTGYLHVGSARSALFNWLYARKTGGTFILRIEDTDADRSRPELIDNIRDSLRWLGMDWDEEYRQSDRFEAYLAAVDGFLDSGQAYYCDCRQDDVRARVGDRGGYDGHCRDRGVGQPPDGSGGHVVRFRTPDEGITGWHDLIRGRVEFDNSTLEDFVIVRSNGVPMFHVANAYDDFDMGITHVVRGEDLVNTVPRVLLLLEALGAPEPPKYAHLPLIVNDQRKKLSKRRDDVSVADYASRGYLPEAMRNYLITLGWGAKDDIEIRPIEEIIERFDLVDINKAPAFFDIKKLDHFNGEYIRMLEPDAFVEASLPYAGEVDPDLYRRLAPFVQERIRRYDEVPALIEWVHGEPPEPEEKEWRKVMGKDDVPKILDLVIDRLETVDWEAPALTDAVLGAGEELGTRSQLPVRMAVTGRRSGLPLFEPMAEMEREVVLDRLRKARARLG